MTSKEEQLDKVREEMAEILYYQNFREEARGKVTSWVAVSEIVKNDFRKDAGYILDHPSICVKANQKFTLMGNRKFIEVIDTLEDENAK